MKKTVIRNYIYIAAIVTFLGITASPLFAQSNRGSGNLRRVNTASFYFSSLQAPALYPETDYQENPAVLSALSSPLLMLDLQTAFSSSSATYTHLDDSVGSKDGTFTDAVQAFDPSLSAGYFSPLKNSSSGSVIGVNFGFDMQMDRNLEKYSNYTVFSENIKITEIGTPFDVGADFYFATGVKKLELGFSAGYTFGYSPAVFSVVQDANLGADDAGIYYNGVITDNDVFTHSAQAALGTVISLSRAAEFYLGVNYTGDFSDGSHAYTVIDKDGDGFAESKVTMKEYYFTETENGGPDDLAQSYDVKDLTIGTNVVLSPTLRLYVADAVELFITGDYTVLDISRRNFYERILLVEDIITADQSNNFQVFNSSFTSFDAMGGLGIDAGNSNFLKIGIGFEREDTRFSQEGWTAEGISQYSRLNTENYTELNLGQEPVNNSIVGQVDYPSTDLTQSIILHAGLEHQPKNGIGLYFSVDLSASRQVQTYYAYNLDTRSVWYEKITNDGLYWEINPVAGISFPMGKEKNVIWTLDVAGTGSYGDPVTTYESAPFDTYQEAVSSNGSSDLSDSASFDFEINTGLLIRM